MASSIYKSKSSNTFRFKSFADRVGEIDLRRTALYHIGHENEELPEENETYFHQTLKKWMVLNLSDEFGAFSRRVLKIVTLPQLLHQRNFVIDLLLERLSTATCLSLQPLLELLYVLARDLREEFYAYFQRVLDRLICLLNTADADQLEWTLVCLAHLFKTLKPHLKRNIGVVFHAILPLLDEQRYEEHVTNFAVECFSFIARDLKDFQKFLDFILATVAREQVESVQGCGRLLYEIMRGIKGCFHSTAGDFLHFVFGALVAPRATVQLALLADIVSHAVDNILAFVAPQNMLIFWTQLCTVAQQCEQRAQLAQLLPIFVQAVEQREGRYVMALEEQLVPTILQMIEKCKEEEEDVQEEVVAKVEQKKELPKKSKKEQKKQQKAQEQTLEVKELDSNDAATVEQDNALQLLAQLVSQMVLCSGAKMTQLDTCRLLKEMLTVPQREVFAEFTLLIVEHAQFELLALPTVLRYFETYFDAPAFELLATVVLRKQPLALSAANLTRWQPYALPLKQKQTLQQLQQKMQKLDFVCHDTLEENVLLLILLPHLATQLEVQSLQKMLQAQLTKLLLTLKEAVPEEKQQTAQTLRLLTLLVETLLHLQLPLPPALQTLLMQALLPHLQTHLSALHCIDQLLQALSAAPKLLKQHENALNEALAPLLSAPAHEQRLIAAHALCQLHKRNADATPHATIYAAELIEPTIHNYREQLLLLQRLETSGEFYKSWQLPLYKQHVLRYLFGLLYNNFKYVWQPVLQLLEAYARDMPLEEFWAIYREQLQATSDDIAKNYALEKIVEDEEKETVEAASLLWRSSTLCALLDAQQLPLLTQQSLLSYRQLLWQRLPQFGQLGEVKNRELVTSFLSFVQQEYRAQLEQREYTWDLSAQASTATELMQQADAEDEEEEMENEQEEDEENDEEAAAEDEDANEKPLSKKSQKSTAKKSGKKRSSKKKSAAQQRQHRSASNVSAKSLLQTLQLQMQLFAAQPNPKALHRNAELHTLWLQLLATPNAQLQKQALDCLLAYKTRALILHKEELQALIDEQRFKDTLINFKVSSLNDEERLEIMPLMLRLLYGKMLTRGTQKTLNAQLRKGLVLRFLGQCSLTEIFDFLHMAFGRYARYTAPELALEDVPALLQSEFVLSAVPAPKKLQSVVNLLELIRKEFGGLLDESFQLYMLKLLFYVCGVCNAVATAAANQSNQTLHPKLPLVYKNVRQCALQSLLNFHQHMAEFRWTTAQVATLTQLFVWPTLVQLPQDSIHTPTLLLRLLLQWGEQPTQHWQLQQLNPTTQLPIFHYIIALLLHERAKPAVRKPIMALVERLLDADTPEALALIRPHIASLLQRLKLNFSVRSARQSLDKRDLHVLSLLTAHVEQPEACDSLLQLLLPILIAKTQTGVGAEVVCQIITTLGNLIRRLPAPELYLLKLAPLFEQLQEVSARKLLCQLISDIAKQRLSKKHMLEGAPPLSEVAAAQLRNTARLMLLLNAWDRRWLEQPDFDKRLDALKEIRELLLQRNVSMELGVLVIYNCIYFIRYGGDMGLRDNASEHLQLLVPQLVAQYAADDADAEAAKQLNYLVGDVLLNLLRRLLRDTHDNVRAEGIKLLGVMARECATSHPILADLAPLADAADAEVDFFENMTHLQSHRHGRALLRFNAHAATLRELPQPRTLTQFVLPLATRYLLSEQHASKHTLVDAAIETLGVACQLLPWQHYHALLRYYLMRMRTSHEQQRQCVRIVVRILDAFHFDLKHAHADQKELEQLRREMQEKQQALVEKEQALAEKEQKISDVKEDDDDDAVEERATKAEDETLQLEDELNAEANAQDFSTDNAAAEVPVLQRTLLLTPSASRRVMATIATILIPTLNRCISAQSTYDNKHKVNRKRLGFEREEEEIQRVPIALALVKLMQKLPAQVLEAGLAGVFMKVCTFLRSPLKSVRMLTRDILCKIMRALGAAQLPLLMEHLQSLLTRGFQVHVLAVTVHGVLDALSAEIQPEQLERCLHNVLDVALNDIFGELHNEQREQQKFSAHTPEAKPSAKSFLVLQLVARTVRENCLLELLLPFRAHLESTHARKVILKLQDCMARLVTGLADNTHISRESLLIFIYGVVSQSIVDLLPTAQRRELSAEQKEQMRRARPDCFIIAAAPKRQSAMGGLNRKVRNNAQANAHILIEFGLELLHFVLKRRQLLDAAAALDYQPFLQPLLPLLRDALHSTHTRVTTFALRCFAAIWHDEYTLPALAEHQADVVNRLFEILQNFSAFGASKQEDNAQLVRSAYKALVTLLRKCADYAPTQAQLDQLLLYIEQHAYEGEQQSLSFSLLKALLARRVDAPPLHDIMRRISEMSIVSQSDYMREEARSLLSIYIMEYALHNRVDQILRFFSVQLCYKLPAGRLSAVQFLQLVIKKFPSQILSKRAEFLYLSLGTRLVNDEEPSCRQAVAACIEQLLTRLEIVDRQRLFDMTLLFFDAGQKASVREMASALCSRFVQAERQAFAARLPQILPTLVARLTQRGASAAGKFVKAPVAVTAVTTTSQEEDVGAQQQHNAKKRRTAYKPVVANTNTANATLTEEQFERQQRDSDHELIQTQYCLLKIFEFCAEQLNAQSTLVNTLDELAYESQRLLAHEHAWVRSNAAQIIAHILASFDFELIGKKLRKLPIEDDDEDSPKLDFIYMNPEYDIKALVLDLCAQLVPGETPQQMIDEIVKIFLLVANMLRDVPFVTKQQLQKLEKQGEQPDDDLTKINLNWLVRNIRFLVNKEVSKAAHSISMRSALFSLIEALISLLQQSTVEQLAPSLLSLLVREMSEEDQNVAPELRQLALRVGSKLRKRIGSDIYDKLRTSTQTSLMVRRAERKKLLAQEKIHDPVKAAKRKVAVQERKKATKKLKTSVMRGKTADVKQKLLKRKRKAAAEDFF